VITSGASVARKNRAGFAARLMPVRAVMAALYSARNDYGELSITALSRGSDGRFRVSRFPPREMNPPQLVIRGVATNVGRTGFARLSRSSGGERSALGSALPISRRSVLTVELFSSHLCNRAR